MITWKVTGIFFQEYPVGITDNAKSADVYNKLQYCWQLGSSTLK